MEQMNMNFEGEPQEPLLSELEAEIQNIMDHEGPAYKDNRTAAEQLAKLRLEHKKSGKPSVEYRDHYDD